MIKYDVIGLIPTRPEPTSEPNWSISKVLANRLSRMWGPVSKAAQRLMQPQTGRRSTATAFLFVAVQIAENE
jgi:hypothetical protein